MLGRSKGHSVGTRRSTACGCTGAQCVTVLGHNVGLRWGAARGAAWGRAGEPRMAAQGHSAGQCRGTV